MTAKLLTKNDTYNHFLEVVGLPCCSVVTYHRASKSTTQWENIHKLETEMGRLQTGSTEYLGSAGSRFLRRNIYTAMIILTVRMHGQPQKTDIYRARRHVSCMSVCCLHVLTT